MKRTFFTLLLIMSFITAFAQRTTVSPLPQQITWGEVAFSNDSEFYLVGADMADQDAVRTGRKPAALWQALAWPAFYDRFFHDASWRVCQRAVRR